MDLRMLTSQSMQFFRIVKRRIRRRSRRTPQNTKHFQLHKERARALVHERLIHWNQFYNFTYVRVAIRNQSSRWGSCSTKRNLNFNYRIVFLAPELADYIIVHELCHLEEFNHSQDFWNLVEKTIPDFQKRRQLLKEINMATLHD